MIFFKILWPSQNIWASKLYNWEIVNDIRELAEKASISRFMGSYNYTGPMFNLHANNRSKSFLKFDSYKLQKHSVRINHSKWCQNFSLPLIIFSCRRSEQFWKQNTSKIACVCMEIRKYFTLLRCHPKHNFVTSSRPVT